MCETVFRTAALCALTIGMSVENVTEGGRSGRRILILGQEIDTQVNKFVIYLVVNCGPW